MDFWFRQYKGDVMVQKDTTAKQSCYGFLGQIVRRERHNIEKYDYKIEFLLISMLCSMERSSQCRKIRVQNIVAFDFWVRQYRGNVVVQKNKTRKQSSFGFLVRQHRGKVLVYKNKITIQSSCGLLGKIIQRERLGTEK